MIAATIRALQRGYTRAQADPESAVTALVEADSGLYRAAAQAQLDAVAAAFTAGARAYGELREDVLRQWSRWDVEFGILEHEVDLPAPSTSRSSARCRIPRFGRGLHANVKCGWVGQRGAGRPGGGTQNRPIRTESGTPPWTCRPTCRRSPAQ